MFCHAQTNPAATARQLFEQEKWQELIQQLQNVPRTSADLNFYYGVALAHQQRWQESRSALITGNRLAPRDKRFPIELAGIAFKQKRNNDAKRFLRRALQLDPEDTYADEFLATIYFLEGNIEAALKYWNRTGKPKLAEVRNVPPLRIRPVLQDRAFAFAPSSVLTLDEFLASDARVRSLGIFPSYHFELAARPDGNFDIVFRAQERNGFGEGRLGALLRVFGGIFFQEITPEYYNLHGSAINLTSLFRWDPDKRRATAAISAPLGGNPKWHYRVGADLRNENWTVQTSFTGPSIVLAALNLRRESLDASISRLIGSRLGWSSGVEFSHRDFRNVLALQALTPPLLAEGYQLKETTEIDYALFRSPERRLSIASSLNSQTARLWSGAGESSEKLQASLDTHWYPEAKGDDYEIRWRLRAGKTFGQIPFDELLMLGGERDNDLWLRAHLGTRHGQKGSAPLGRNYVLSNWDTDRHVFTNGYITAKLGPFLDVAKITDASPELGSRKWLFDTGAQAKLRVLGVGIVVYYGKDLRTGNNAFYTTVSP